MATARAEVPQSSKGGLPDCGILLPAVTQLPPNEPRWSDVTMEDRIEELRERREEALLGGGEDRIQSQHDKGKMTARERIDYFLDDDSFNEFDQFRTRRNQSSCNSPTLRPIIAQNVQAYSPNIRYMIMCRCASSPLYHAKNTSST